MQSEIPPDSGGLDDEAFELRTFDKPTTRDLQHREEDARQWMVRTLLLTLAGVLAGAVVTVNLTTEAAVLDFLQHLVTALVGLVGTAVGFYFGKRS